MLFLTKCILYAQESRASERGGQSCEKTFHGIYVLTIILVLNLFWGKTNRKLLQCFVNKKKYHQNAFFLICTLTDQNVREIWKIL